MTNENGSGTAAQGIRQLVRVEEGGRVSDTLDANASANYPDNADDTGYNVEGRHEKGFILQAAGAMEARILVRTSKTPVLWGTLREVKQDLSTDAEYVRRVPAGGGVVSFHTPFPSKYMKVNLTDKSGAANLFTLEFTGGR